MHVSGLDVIRTSQFAFRADFSYIDNKIGSGSAISIRRMLSSMPRFLEPKDNSFGTGKSGP